MADASDASPPYDAKVGAVRRLYDALAAGDRETLAVLLHPEFIGRATAGLPLGVGASTLAPTRCAANSGGSSVATTT